MELLPRRAGQWLCLLSWLLATQTCVRQYALQAADRPTEGSAASSVLPRLEPALQKFIDDHEISGAVTLVSCADKFTEITAIGEADVETHRPMRPDTLFAIASMTKPITATALMILWDAGKLSLDDPVEKYLPEFKEAALASGPPQRTITIRDLLTHTAGLHGEQRNEGTLAESVVKFAHRPLAYEPGTKWQYSPAISVCGRIVEVVAGQPYDAFLAARIFGPLQMKDTSFMPSAEQQKRIAQLYERDKDSQTLKPAKHWITDLALPNRSPNPSGGLFSTAPDLLRFYRMILNRGELDGQRIVSPEAVAEMTRLQTGDLTTGFTPGNGWGLGWCVVRQPQGVSEVLSPGSFGHGGAFGTQAWLDPKREAIYVLLIQRVGLPNSDGSPIRAEFQKIAGEAVSSVTGP
jgi:CubicO group peptidase (beta-lactamase class C family)